MNDLQNFSSDDDLNVYLIFHLMDDSSYAKEKGLITQALSELFGDAYSLEDEAPEGLVHREIIFRVAKPLLMDTSLMRTFFENLSELFEATQRFEPAFTQSTEAKRD